MWFFQFACYCMMEIDNSWKYKLSPTTSIYKTIFVLVAAESTCLAVVYDFTEKVIFGVREVGMVVPMEWLVIYSGGMIFLHRLVLGPKERIDHYKKIFDEWSPAKQTICKLALVMIVLVPFGVLFWVGTK